MIDKGIDNVTKKVKDGSQEWGMEEIAVEIAICTNAASISGDVPRIIVEWQEVAPSAKV